MKRVFIYKSRNGKPDAADIITKRLSKKTDENGERLFSVESCDGSAAFFDEKASEAVCASDLLICLICGALDDDEKAKLFNAGKSYLSKKFSLIMVRLRGTLPVYSDRYIPLLEWPGRSDCIDRAIDRILIEADEETNKINKTLHKKLCISDITGEADILYGREDIIKKAEDFIKSGDCGPLILRGPVGSGKTAVLAELAKNISLISSMHVCDRLFKETVTPQLIFANLAYHLSAFDADYASYLASAKITKPESCPSKQLFEQLFNEYLKNNKKNFVFIIDGINAMRLSDARELIALLRTECRLMPQLKFIISFNDGFTFNDDVAELPSVELTEKANNSAIHLMVKNEFVKRKAYNIKLQRYLAEKAEGCFLFLKRSFEHYDRGLTDFKGSDSSEGLISEFNLLLNDYISSPVYFKTVLAPVLGALCVVERPVTEAELAEITNTGAAELKDVLKALRFIVKCEEGRISVFNRNMKKMLLRGYSEYKINRDEATKAIVANGKKALNNRKECSEYVKEYIFFHIFLATDSVTAQELIFHNPGWATECIADTLCRFDERRLTLFARTFQQNTTFILFLRSIINRLVSMKEYDTALKALEAFHDSETFKTFADMAISDVLTEAGRLDEAEKFCRRIIADVADLKAPDTRALRKAAFFISKLKRIAYTQNDYNRAELFNDLATEVIEKLIKDLPEDEGLRGNLIFQYIWSANLARERGDKVKAEKKYRLAAAKAKQIAEEVQTVACFEYLTDAYCILADYLLTIAKADDAKKYYLRSVIFQRYIVRNNPNRDRWMILMKAYRNLGLIEKYAMNKAEALGYYILAADICEYTANTYGDEDAYSLLTNVSLQTAEYAETVEDFDTADKYRLLSFEARKTYVEKYPSDDSRSSLIYGYSFMAEAELKEGHRKEAIAILNEGIKLAQNYKRNNPCDRITNLCDSMERLRTSITF